MILRPRGAPGGLALGLRFTLLLIAGTVMVSVLVGVALAAMTERRLQSEIRSNAQILVSSLDWALAPLLAEDDLASVQRLCENIGSAPSLRAVRVCRADGSIAASSVLEEIGTTWGSPLLAQVFAGRRLVATVDDFPHETFVIAVPVRGRVFNASQASDISAAIVLEPDIGEENRASAPFTTGLVLLGVALTVCLVGLYTFFLSRWILGPLGSLTRTIHSVRASGARAETDLPAELGDLARLFNTLFDEIDEKNRAVQAYAADLESRVADRTLSLQLARQDEQAAYDELKKTQTRLLESAKMASIGQLAAGVAHEINNPMAFIKSNLTTMKRYAARLRAFAEGTLAGGNPQDLSRVNDLSATLEDLDPLLEDSLEGSARVESIVRSLKGFAHADTGEVTFVNLNGLLEDTLRVIASRLKYKAQVTTELGDIPRVRCNAQRLNQVFLNLLVNAAEAIEKNGAILVRTWRGPSEVHVAIKDNGTGIPPEILSRIYEPFFTTKPVGQGTGLGLAISYDIVAKHGGAIDVQSAPGAGTTFTVTLPIDGNGAQPAGSGADHG
jgi:signal transduction histidine kinase